MWICIVLKTAFFGKTKLTFWGHDESNNSKTKGNFTEILHNFGDKNLKKGLPRYENNTSPEVRLGNDLISAIAIYTKKKHILNEINPRGFYTTLVDEIKKTNKKKRINGYNIKIFR